MIYVFKTSVTTIQDVEKLKPELDVLSKNTYWNFDLEDCDNIFRIDSPFQYPKSLVDLLTFHGFECVELES